MIYSIFEGKRWRKERVDLIYLQMKMADRCRDESSKIRLPSGSFCFTTVHFFLVLHASSEVSTIKNCRANI